MADLYDKCALVHGDLNATNILQDGSFIDVAQAMDKTLPKALDFLYKDCKNIAEVRLHLLLYVSTGLAKAHGL
jgi:RIO kinase 3